VESLGVRVSDLRSSVMRMDLGKARLADSKVSTCSARMKAPGEDIYSKSTICDLLLMINSNGGRIKADSTSCAHGRRDSCRKKTTRTVVLLPRDAL